MPFEAIVIIAEGMGELPLISSVPPSFTLTVGEASAYLR